MDNSPRCSKHTEPVRVEITTETEVANSELVRSSRDSDKYRVDHPESSD